jgi:transcription elongation factor Elf1
MSIYIDRKFLHLVSPRLDRFARKNDDLYNFRCPLCGDSQKNKTKSRGFVYRKGNDYFYRCHNCGASHTFYNFLRHVDSSLVKEYSLERYKNGETGNNNYPKPTFDEFKAKPTFKKKINLPSIAELPDEHYAKKYVLGRQIPIIFHSELYYAEDFKKFVESLEIDKDGLKENDPRLIIPFYNENKELIAFQGRALTDSKIRYITITVNKDVTKFFGLDRIDRSKRVYVVEGPIDSMFIPNAIATADSDLARVKQLNLEDVVLVYDNEPRNKEIVRQMNKSANDGFNICVLPESTDSKDINDQILNGKTSKELMDMIDKYTFSGLRLTLELSNWRKI